MIIINDLFRRRNKKKYLSILQNFKDGLDVFTPIRDKYIPPKPPERV